MTRRIFVTGGAHGIGKSIVGTFVNRGDRVAFCDIDTTRGEAVAVQTGATFYQVDVTDAAQLEAAMQQLFDTWGDIDVLVNNVGIGIFKPPSLRRALIVSRAITLPPIAACTGISNIWRGIFSLSRWQILRARG